MDANELLGLDGTAAIVTGGGSGIGRACALLLARVGASVSVVDLDDDRARRTVDDIEAAGGRALCVCGDAREPSTAEQAARATREHYGRTDILVNNVGGTFFAQAEKLSLNGWQAVFRFNLDTTFLFSQAVAPAMIEAGKGAIVNVASIVGLTASPYAAHYGAAKAAIISLTRTLALEWAPAVRVNAVAPEFVRTEGSERFVREADRERMLALTPLRRLAVPDDIAKAVVFLASDMASFITGQTLVIDGGSLLQSRLDFVARPDEGEG